MCNTHSRMLFIFYYVLSAEELEKMPFTQAIIKWMKQAVAFVSNKIVAVKKKKLKFAQWTRIILHKITRFVNWCFVFNERAKTCSVGYDFALSIRLLILDYVAYSAVKLGC